MTTHDDVLERLALARAHSWGPARSNLVAEAVTWADALEDEQLAVDTRLALAEAYNQGNEEWKALAPFVWLLDRHAERPDLFDASRIQEMNWNYKWAIHVAADNPGVSVAQLRELQAGLEEFYRSQGASMHVVHGERHHAAVMLGLEEEAETELAAWRATPRDSASDCEGCDPMRQVTWATSHGDWDLAVATAVPVLNEEVGCVIQPAAMQAAALMALLHSGRPKAAWDAHVRSYRSLKGRPQFLGDMGRHMEYLALTGRVTRGMRILRESLPMSDQCESAVVLMGLLTGASLILREAVRADMGQETLGVSVPADSVWCPGPGLEAGTTLEQAHAEVEAWARAVASLYDARNGNTTVSQRLEDRLGAEPVAAPREVAARGALAAAGTELLETGEELPEGICIGVQDEEEAASFLEGITAMPSILGGSEPERSPEPSTEAAAAEPESDPYPVVDLRVPQAPRDADEVLRRIHALTVRPGGNLESMYVGCQAIARDLLPDPDQDDPELALTAWAILAATAEIAWDYETAVEHRLRRRALLPEDDELGLVANDLRVIKLEHNADELANRVTVAGKQERLERAGGLAERLAGVTEGLLAAPEGRQKDLVRAFDASMLLAELLPEFHEYDGARESLDQARRISGLIAHLVDPAGGELDDFLDLAQAELDLARGKVYEACILADEVLRRHNPCPILVAVGARRILAMGSIEVEEHDETVVQMRECLNIYLATGMTPLTGGVFGGLASALGMSGRALEAAEVLETALGSDVPDTVADRLRAVLVSVLDNLDEEEGVRSNALSVAERALDHGETDRASEFLVRAANAAYNLDDNTQAAALFQRVADLEDVSDNGGKVRRSRLLRRAARAIVDDRTLAMSRARLDESRAIMARARQLIEDVPASRRYSADYEIGDWHDDMAWILWRTDENAEAVDHCEAAFTGYMSTKDRDSAARPLTLLVRLHAEREDKEQARAAIARVRELLAHRRWENHPALATVANIEESFED
ncbi:MAG: kinase [Actinomyces sp.]|uniref:kinase n=1 Tax=Actinomyces sp. TaxID=29317 RepID=UPI0026DD9CA8|nr:kinase [Actinomyces sp.]MDO4242883.1 kinase [Actinomyces sp.]